MSSFSSLTILVPIWVIIIHQIFSLARDWSKHVTRPNIPLGHIREYSPIFKTRIEKKMKNNKHNSLHLGRKICSDICPRTSSVPEKTLSEDCSLFGTDIVCGQTSEHIFAPNGDYCLFIISCSAFLSEQTIIFKFHSI